MSRPTILLVDSHEDSRLIYAAVLDHQGFEVVTCACCEEAAELARAHRPALVVVAVSLAPAPAWALLDTLRQRPETAGVPVLALSTTGMGEHRRRAMELGCADVLEKPLAPMELVAAVRRLLG